MIRAELLAAPTEVAPASIVEREARQQAALRVVTDIARGVSEGKLPVYDSEIEPSLNPGVYLLQPGAAEHQGLKTTQFQFDKRMMSGSANSAHAVIKGALDVTFGDETHSSLSVAAKFFENRKRSTEVQMQRAMTEVDTMRMMRQQSQEFAFNPVALAVSPSRSGENVNIVLLTEHMDGMYSLDNGPWGRGPTSANVETAVLAAQALGRFNRLGMVHKDSKIKNVGADGTHISMIDFETSVPFDLDDPRAAAMAARTDMSLLLTSLDPMFRAASGTTELKKVISTICEDGYLIPWRDAPTEVQDSVLDVVAGLSNELLDTTTVAAGAGQLALRAV